MDYLLPILQLKKWKNLESEKIIQDHIAANGGVRILPPAIHLKSCTFNYHTLLFKLKTSESFSLNDLLCLHVKIIRTYYKRSVLLKTEIV